MKARSELKIGIFVTIVLVASFILINFLRGRDIFNREMSLVSYFDNVQGLVTSAPVYVKGYKVGMVTDVEYLPATGNFRIEYTVNRKFAVPEDSRLVLYNADIMGGKGLRIEEGSSANVARDGAELESATEPGLLSEAAGGIGTLVQKAASTLDAIETAASNLNAMLEAADPQSLSRTLAHLESTMADVKKVSSSISGKSGELSNFISNLEKVSLSLESVISKADSTMTDFGAVAASLNEADLEGLVRSFRDLADRIQDPDGSLGKILTDDGLYDSLDELLSDIDSLVKKIEENPKKYIRISVF